MSLSEANQLQIDYSALVAKYLHQSYNHTLFHSFKSEFDLLLEKHKLFELKYAVQRPDPTINGQTIVITPLTAASEIVLLHMMGRLS